MTDVQQYEKRVARRRIGRAVGLGLTTLLVGRWWWGNLDPATVVPTPAMPSPNAFDAYSAAGAALGTDAERKTLERALEPVTSSKPEKRPTEKDWEAAREAVARHRPRLDALRAAFGLEYRQPPSRSVADTYPYLAQYRTLARLLVAEGRLKERAGDARGAAACYLDAVRLGEDVSWGGPLIGFLTGRAVETVGLRALERAAPTLPGDVAADAARRLASARDRHASAADALTEEKHLCQAWMLAAFDDPRGTSMLSGATPRVRDGFAPNLGMLNPLFLVWPRRQVMANFTAHADAHIARARVPYDRAAPPIPEPSDYLSRIVAPVLGGVHLRDRVSAFQRESTIATLALRAHAADHGGKAPATLADLAPRYLPAVPVDPFAQDGARPLGYRAAPGTATGYVLYSVGPDGDDDNGTPIDNTAPLKRAGERWVKEKARRIQPESDGDAVFGVNR